MIKSLYKLKMLLVKLLELLLVVAVLLLVFSVSWGVISRSIGELVVWLSQNWEWTPWEWLPTGQTKWTEELARFLLIWVALIGGAVAFGTKGHLGVDYFVGKFEPGARKMMAIFSHLVVLFFAVSIFVVGGGRVVYDALILEQMTPALGWKMGHVYLALPLAGIFMVLFTVENLLETLMAPADQISEADAVGEVE